MSAGRTTISAPIDPECGQDLGPINMTSVPRPSQCEVLSEPMACARRGPFHRAQSGWRRATTSGCSRPTSMRGAVSARDYRQVRAGQALRSYIEVSDLASTVAEHARLDPCPGRLLARFCVMSIRAPSMRRSSLSIVRVSRCRSSEPEAVSESSGDARCALSTGKRHQRPAPRQRMSSVRAGAAREHARPGPAWTERG